jgi:transposase
MAQSIAGIDVSKLTLDVVLMQGEQMQHRVIQNDPKGFRELTDWMSETHPTQMQACMEATGRYGLAAAEYLYACGYQVSVVNPARIKAYATSKLRRNKTDKADAKLIAEFCEKEKPALWSPLPAHFQALKDLIYHLEDLQSTKQQEHNRMEFKAAHQLVNENRHAHITLLEEQIRKVRKAIHIHILAYPDLMHLVNLLVSIPGIGEITAAWILVEIRDFRDFSNARQLAAYAGLNPRINTSGTSVHKKARLSKTGNAKLRKALYLPAVVAKNHNPIIRELGICLNKRGLCKMEIIGAAMRKLLHLAYGVLKNDLPFDPIYLEKQMINP